MRVLSKFGEIQYYKNMRYDALSSPSTAIAIFKDENAARQCWKAGPIHVRMEHFGGRQIGEVQKSRLEPLANDLSSSSRTASAATEQSDEMEASRAAGHAQASSSNNNPASPHSEQSEDRPEQASPKDGGLDAEPEPKVTHFKISTSLAYSHFRDQVNDGHYHGRFILSQGRASQASLINVVPLRGLSEVDWQAMPVPWRVSAKAKLAEREGPHRRKSLREVYETASTEGRIELPPRT